MRALFRDLHFAWRSLVRHLGFTFIAVLCLALSMGTTTAVFTVVNAVLFRTLPYKAADRLVRIYSEFPTLPNGGMRRFPISPPEFLEMRESLHSYKCVDAWLVGGVNLTTAKEPVRVNATSVSGTLFESLGVPPVQGRWIDAADEREGTPLAIVISNGLARRAFGGTREAVGRATKLNGLSATIVGVMPAGFEYPPGQVDVSELWSPLQLSAVDRQQRANHQLAILAKLRDGVSIEQARQELAAKVSSWGERKSNKFHTVDPTFHPFVEFPMQEEVVRSVRPAMLVILGAVAFVLLIACVNVANLLLVRAETRQRDIAVRVAMGVGTTGLIRQFIAEGLLISAAGAAAGLGIAIFGVHLLLRVGSDAIPRLTEVSFDWRVLDFTGAVLIATTIVFGLIPLADALSRSTHETLKGAVGWTSGSAGVAALRRGMVVAELSLALVLLVCCVLMLQAFWRLQVVDAGFDPSHLLTMRVALAGYPNEAAATFLSRLEDALTRLPGVASATVMSGMPPQRPGDFADTQIENFVAREGGPIENVDYWQFVGDLFFETLGAHLVEGRFLNTHDGREAPPVVVVNETMARAFWPGQDPLGRRVRLQGSNAPWRTIVGVVADIKNGGVERPTGTELFIPWRQVAPFRTVQVVVRTVGDPLLMTSSVRGIVAQMEPSLPVAAVRTMEEVVAQSHSRPRFLSALLTFFAAVALSLAAIGVYGVISYSVARRTQEIGIRMALGADSGRILRTVLKEGALLGAVGVVIGVSGGAGLTRLIKSILFGIEPLDMRTFATAVLLLFGLTLIASWIPARRATRIDPTVALRHD